MYRQSLNPIIIPEEFSQKPSLSHTPMKIQLVTLSRPWCCLAAAGLALLTASEVRALDMIDPTGAVYINVTNSSQFNSSFTASNLFSQNMTGVAVGQTIGGSEWAKS